MSALPVASHQRGSLELARGVVEKIAGQAAREVTAVGGMHLGMLGIGSQADLSVRPTADVVLGGRGAEVRLRVAVGYPTSLRSATDAVRANVVDRLQNLCGVTVSRVDIEIIALTRHAGPDRGGLL